MRLPKTIPQAFLSRRRSLEALGLGDPAWQINDAKDLMQALRGTTVAVLGGDIYHERQGILVSSYDNWYTERTPHESLERFALRSQSRALEYLERYQLSSDAETLVGLVMTDEATAGL
jgi:hypothetical protein